MLVSLDKEAKKPSRWRNAGEWKRYSFRERRDLMNPDEPFLTQVCQNSGPLVEVPLIFLALDDAEHD
jgi:hypothetical protein